MRYRDANSNLKSHINTLRVALVGEALLIAALWYGWVKAKEDVRIHIPPDLRAGVALKADEISAANVYSFALGILQELNHWPEDGEDDFGQQIFRMAPYLTPPFRARLEADMELRGKRGELAGRIRTLQPMPGHGFDERRVEMLGDGVWVVWLDTQIREYVGGMLVKDTPIRYPLRVVHYVVGVDDNPWGLALDGYHGEGPRPVPEESENDEKTGARTAPKKVS